MSFQHWVAMRIPFEAKDAASQIVAQATGNPADLATFLCQITDGEDVQWLTQIPMRTQYFEQLPAFQAQIGGEYALMAQRVDGRWVQLDSVWDWVHRSGFRAVVLPDDDI
jgi:hypothetical protein